MVMAGVSPKVVAELVGDSVDVVLGVHSHVSPTSKVDALAAHTARIAAHMERATALADTTS
jgi:hypothetical protein